MGLRYEFGLVIGLGGRGIVCVRAILVTDAIFFDKRGLLIALVTCIASCGVRVSIRPTWMHLMWAVCFKSVHSLTTVGEGMFLVFGE